MKPHIIHKESNPDIHRTEPDIIIRTPITIQPLMSSSGSTARWSYIPSGSAPVERPSILPNLDCLPSQIKANQVTESKQMVSVSTRSGSRDWSKDLFESFKEVRRSKNKCSGIANLCCKCLCLPCMMSKLASSLGDKVYLPFIPGTTTAIRFKVRILGGIHGTIANDCLVTCCCCPCAMCQMYQEIEDIGLGVTW